MTVAKETAISLSQYPYPIVLANEVEHLEPLSHLLNAHRVALGKANDQPAVSHFLFERIINHEALIFLALEGADPLSQLPAKADQGKGLLMIYPTFSAQSLMPVWILGELFVAPQARRHGVARSLMNEALDLIQQRGDEGFILEVPQDNTAARQLLESMNFQQNATLTHYAYRFPSAKA